MDTVRDAQGRTADRIPPQNIEAEGAVLGSAMCDQEIAERVVPMLHHEEFYAWIHGLIFTAVSALVKANERVDVLSLAAELQKRGVLEKTGGVAYLSSLVQTVQTVNSAVYLARIVHEKALCREMIAAGMTIQQLGWEGEEDVTAALGQANTLTRGLFERAATKSGASMVDLQSRYVDEMLAVPQGIFALQTPWAKLDKLTGGFVGGELVIWASDPGVGKSFALNMLAAHTAEHYGEVIICATEMGSVRTYARLIALYSGVSVRQQRKWHELSDSQRASIKQAADILSAAPLTLYEGSLGTDDVISLCRKHKRQGGLYAAFVDTLGALADVRGLGGHAKRNSSKHERQEASAYDLVACAQELDISIHAAMHFSRGDGQTGKMPTKQRLRDGGNVEGTATTIIFPHYHEPEHQFMFICDKARDGSRGTVKMDFFGDRAVWLQTDQESAWCELTAETRQGLLELNGYLIAPATAQEGN